MSNSYLKSVIRKIDWYIIITVTVLIFCSFITGRYFYFSGWLNIIVGLVLGLIGGLALVLIDYFINKQQSYTKGLYLEDKIAEKLDNLNIEYKQHVETEYGDLDLLVTKNSKYYGIEAKNWDGEIKFSNGLLRVNNFDCTYVLHVLLGHCLLVRNKQFGDNSGKFINPVLIFGFKSVVSIPDNKIIFNNQEIIIATIKDFEQYFK